MPADFIKFELNQEGIADKLRQCPILDFDDRKTKNGNIVSEAWYKNMKFEIYEPSMVVEVSGSLHYLFNDCLFNWNDFKRLDLFDTIFMFCGMFGIEPQKATLHGFEIGINIHVPFEPSYFIERILAYKTGTIERLTDRTEEKNAIKIDFEQYRLKIYDKSSHQKGLISDSELNILRFEVKIKRMAKVSMTCGIKTLHDLLKIDVLQKLGRLLLNEFNRLIVSEPMNLDSMKPAERATFEKMNNRTFWRSINTKSQRRDSKKRFKELTKKYGDGLHEKTFNLVSEKWFDLLQYADDKIKFVPFNGVEVVESKEKTESLSMPNQTNFAPFNHLNIIRYRAGVR